MNKSNVDQALTALIEALRNEQPTSFLENPKEFVKKIPLRSLSGDHINGGKIHNLSSLGLSDKATQIQITISDDGVKINRFAEGFEVNGTVNATKIITDKIEAKSFSFESFEEFVAQSPILQVPVIFKNDSIDGLGFLWQGKHNTKQLIYASNPDRIFISENLELGKGKSFHINNIKVLDEISLGSSVTRSNLKELGRLNGLLVDGYAAFNQHFFFDNNSNRLGIGTDQPNGTISIAENNVELLIGTKETCNAILGTYNSSPIDFITDNQSRINISSDGNIILGNFKNSPIQVSINGKLAIRVKNPDPDVDLHINGSVKFSGKLQTCDTSFPSNGEFNKGDIVWNSDPRLGSYVGWICIQTGTPGLWEPFGKIGNQ